MNCNNGNFGEGGKKNYGLKHIPSLSSLKEVVVGGLVSPTSSLGSTATPRSSVEDLSEYTDADETISAPTEFLAEFLSAMMMKDYGNALKYCNLMHDETSSSSESEESSSDDNRPLGKFPEPEDSDATTASYSSLEDEEVDTKHPDDNADVGNGNGSTPTPPQGKPFLASSSDSESPTEPISQTIACI